ncbi:AMP-binding protein [Paraburkholderia phymatum]|uniref:AMP-binding protein n=1 Tax=Paraburkholderia phymatum TaxID=148447 RepID=UPI0031792A6D
MEQETVVDGPASAAMLRAGTFWGLVSRRAAATPDAPMLLDATGGRITYAEFATAAERLAAGLLKVGIGPGTPVTWQLPTRITTALLVAALSRLGAVQNPIIHLYRERETSAVLRESRSAWFIVPSRFGGRDFEAFAREILAALPTPPNLLVFDGELPDGDPASLPPPVSCDAVRWVVYTSGTTSAPKGVRHTDSTIMAAGYALGHALAMNNSDVGTIAYPFAHIGGPMYLAMMLANGMSAVMIENFVPAQAAALFRRLGVTQSGGSTTHYQAYLDEQRKAPDEQLLPRLRMLTGGGAPKPPALFRQVKDELGCIIAHAYGMTEVPLIAQGSPGDSEEQLTYTEGRVVDGVEVKIVKRDGTVARAGEEGEVYVRGATVCHGYTDEALNVVAFDREGFFRTGDLGVLRTDGHISLTGRLKDVIIRKGENVAAKELEDLLITHPSVGAVAVIGLPDAERGERVCAVVEAKAGRDPLRFEEMVSFLKSTGLMMQKIPEQLEVVERLPRNETFNKVLKHKLREQFAKPA